MIGSKAVTFPVDRVKRSAPAGASPSRTLSKMLPEQNGAYGGHLDTFFPTKDRLAERQRTGPLTRGGYPVGSVEPLQVRLLRRTHGPVVSTGSTPALQAGSGGPNPPGSIPRRLASCLRASSATRGRRRAGSLVRPPVLPRSGSLLPSKSGWPRQRRGIGVNGNMPAFQAGDPRSSRGCRMRESVNGRPPARHAGDRGPTPRSRTETEHRRRMRSAGPSKNGKVRRWSTACWTTAGTGWRPRGSRRGAR